MLQFGNRDEGNVVAFRATSAFGEGAAGFMDYPPGHVEGFPDTFKMLFRNIYAAIAGRKDEHLFATACDFVQKVPVRRLTFYPDRRVWDEIRNFDRMPEHV